MISEQTQTIAVRSQKQRLYNKVSAILLAVLVILTPFVVYLFDFGMASREWRFDVISQFIREGTIWVVPNHALFQTNVLLFSREDNATGLAVLALVVGFAVVFTLICLVVGRILSSILSKIILAGTRPYLSSKNSAIFNTARALSLSDGGTRTSVSFRGDSLVYSQALSHQLPDIYIDSRNNDLARQEGISFDLPKDFEVVLNGTLFEQFKIYIHPSYHEQVSLLFSAVVIATLTKQLGHCEILIQNNMIYLVSSAKSQSNPKQVDFTIQGLSHLNQLLSSLAQKNSLSINDNSRLTLRRRRFIKLPFGLIIPRSVYYSLAVLLLTPTLLLCLLAPDWANLSDMFAIASIMTIILLIASFQNYRQRTTQGEFL